MKQHILLWWWWWFFSLNSHIPIFSPHLPYPYFQPSSPLSLFFHPSSPLSLFDFLSSISLNYVVNIQKKGKNLNCPRNDPNVDLIMLTIVTTTIMLRNFLTNSWSLCWFWPLFKCVLTWCVSNQIKQHILLWWLFFLALISQIPIFSPHLPYPYFSALISHIPIFPISHITE